VSSRDDGIAASPRRGRWARANTNGLVALGSEVALHLDDDRTSAPGG